MLELVVSRTDDIDPEQPDPGPPAGTVCRVLGRTREGNLILEGWPAPATPSFLEGWMAEDFRPACSQERLDYERHLHQREEVAR
ncbi:hypothetical protein IZ6_25400 [Terrihabitans soli]|uniref:Uncharacterized protein n=1 Tax=Terrihabitans soli TaxID=708113 RepID=A0A6S6QW46_9HYPH|nr:hypothetical protein IZ6_25400 [Terrihabitans soli]